MDQQAAYAGDVGGLCRAQQRMDGGAVKLSTFIPLQIRKRGARKVAVRPDGESISPTTHG